MKYQSWPKIISSQERTLFTLAYGHMYKLEPSDDRGADAPLILSKDGEFIADIDIGQGKITDFTVNHDLVAIATINPAGLHVCRPFNDTNVLYSKIPMESESGRYDATSVTLGNYGANILALWHGDMQGPVYAGMLSGRDAFRFDAKPLIYYDSTGKQRMYIRQEFDKILAVPHFPGQFSTIAMLSPLGLQFFTLKPFYTMNRFTDVMMETPFVFEPGWTEPIIKGMPDRLQCDAYDLLVQINGNHIMMKYDPAQTIKESKKDWIKITVDGQEIKSDDVIFMSPVDTDKVLNIEAKEDLGSITIHADLPVNFRPADKMPNEALSQTGLKYLPKGSSTDILMRMTRCISRWELARFVEKFNIKIRAEIWS